MQEKFKQFLIVQYFIDINNICGMRKCIIIIQAFLQYPTYRKNVLTLRVNKNVPS